MDQVAQVRNKTDIVGLIQSFIPLKKAGRNFKANCPFHGEKTPSFVVSPERQIWHCFGCSKGGDVFTFLMEYERIEFPEALRILAEKAGIKLENRHFDSKITSKKETLYKINHLASEFYHYLLTKHQIGGKALAYLTQERKISPATINTFGLGFAPFSGNGLVTYLTRKKGFSPQDVLDAGLGTGRTTSLRDFFQGRIIFPLVDHRGNAIGFAGRIFMEKDDGSKYINTRETLIYHKGLTFFGLNIAKEVIKKTNQVLLMEGELDVITSFQEGITNAVAVKGTALTPDQVNLLARFAQKITLCFDADMPGQEALKRSVGLLEKKGLTITVVRIPGGKDPDDSIKSDPIAFKKAVKEDIGIYDFLLEEENKAYNPQTAEGKKKIGDDLLPMLDAIDNEIVKEHYLRRLADMLATSYEVLVREIDNKKKKDIIKEPVFLTKTPRGREEILEEYVVGLLLQHENSKPILETLKQPLGAITWQSASYSKILERLKAYASSHDSASGKDIAQSLPQELLPTFDTCLLLPLPQLDGQDEYNEELKKSISELENLSLKRRIKSLGQQITQKEKEGLLEDVEKLQQEFSTHLGQLKK